MIAIQTLATLITLAASWVTPFPSNYDADPRGRVAMGGAGGQVTACAQEAADARATN